MPVTDTIARVEYRIAYIAICIENSASGRGLFKDLNEITAIDPENIQFCCAEWFWKRQVNSYALQVEPDRFKHKDRAVLDYKEALYIEKIRNEFFIRLDELLKKAKKKSDRIIRQIQPTQKNRAAVLGEVFKQMIKEEIDG